MACERPLASALFEGGQRPGRQCRLPLRYVGVERAVETFAPHVDRFPDLCVTQIHGPGLVPVVGKHEQRYANMQPFCAAILAPLKSAPFLTTMPTSRIALGTESSGGQITSDQRSIQDDRVVCLRKAQPDRAFNLAVANFDCPTKLRVREIDIVCNPRGLQPSANDRNSRKWTAS